MIKTALDTSAPFFIGAGICGSPVLAAAGINGITESELGKTLLVVMAFAVIANQLWQIGERIIRATKGQPQDLTGLADTKLCDQRHNQISKQISELEAADNKQDVRLKEEMSRLERLVENFRSEFRQDIKGLHQRSDAVLQAVSRLEGKVE